MKEALFSAIGGVDDALLLQSEAATVENPRSIAKSPTALTKRRIKWISALCACLALALVIALPLSLMQGEKIPTIHSTAKIYSMPSPDSGLNISIYAPDITVTSSDSLTQYYSPEELATQTDDIFRGEILQLENLIIDYNGKREHRARAVIRITSVIAGDVKVGDEFTIAMPFSFWFSPGVTTSVTGTVEQMQKGMEGIFLVKSYDESSYSEYNGARLQLLEFADGTMPDGERYCLLEGENGLIKHDVWEELSLPAVKFTLDFAEARLRELRGN